MTSNRAAGRRSALHAGPLLRLAASLAVVSACGGETSTDDDGTAPPTGWTTLVSASWHLEPGEEKYVCTRVVTDRDLDLQELRPAAGEGTHHTLLLIDDEVGPLGTFGCDGTAVGRALFASGLGTDGLALPTGVAVHVPRGSRLLLNVHLVGVGSEPIDGTSAIDGLVIEPGDVKTPAEVVLAGKVKGLEIPPGEVVQTGVCTFSAPSTLHALMPHMHARGRHLRVRASRAAGDVDVYDQDFDVDAQRYVLATPAVDLAAGDHLLVDCTYENPGPDTIVFGTAASDEMCYAIFYRYPAIGGASVCDD